MKNLIKLNLVLISVASLISSCKKDEKTETTDIDVETVRDNAFAESSYGDALNISDQAAKDGELTTYRIDSNEEGLLSLCATITNDTTLNPHLLTIDFGSENCECTDGKNRRGKILVSYLGQYRDSASIHTFTFDNYYVNDYKIGGTKTVTNMGHNNNGNLFFNISVNGVITNPSAQNLTWTSSRTREWTEGESTSGFLGWFDDVYKINGAANGTSFNGTGFTANITEPLVVALNCRWIKQGKLEFTSGSLATRYFDYGSGSCDNAATVTINGTTYNISLR
jgi:hypothetical protein